MAKTPRQPPKLGPRSKKSEQKPEEVQEQSVFDDSASDDDTPLADPGEQIAPEGKGDSVHGNTKSIKEQAPTCVKHKCKLHVKSTTATKRYYACPVKDCPVTVPLPRYDIIRRHQEFLEKTRAPNVIARPEQMTQADKEQRG